jgi:hypothetical protein
MVQHIVTEVISGGVGIPAVEVQQPLHPVRAEITGLLRDRPRVLAFCAREQPQQIHPSPPTRLDLCKPARHQREHLIKPCLPPRQTIINGSPRRGHRVNFKIQHAEKSITPWPQR